MKSFVKKTEDVTTKDFEEILSEVGCNFSVDDFEAFIKARFSGQIISTDYIVEWANRIKDGVAEVYADALTKEYLREYNFIED